MFQIVRAADGTFPYDPTKSRLPAPEDLMIIGSCGLFLASPGIPDTRYTQFPLAYLDAGETDVSFVLAPPGRLELITCLVSTRYVNAVIDPLAGTFDVLSMTREMEASLTSVSVATSEAITGTDADPIWHQAYNHDEGFVVADVTSDSYLNISVEFRPATFQRLVGLSAAVNILTPDSELAAA